MYVYIYICVCRERERKREREREKIFWESPGPLESKNGVYLPIQSGWRFRV